MNEIRLANVNDINKIMRFINDNWKENHILSRDKDFFIYEHQGNNTINFVIYLEFLSYPSRLLQCFNSLHPNQISVEIHVECFGSKLN